MKASRKSHSDPTQYDVRFWKKVDQAGDDECWLWQGSTGADGYGVLARTQENGKQKQWMAHRYAFIQTHGAINPELTIDHLCRVRNRDLENRIAEDKGHDYRAELQSVKSSLTAMKRSRDYVLNENRRLKQGDVLVEQKRQTDNWRQRAKALRKVIEEAGLNYRFRWDAETGEILEPMSPEEMAERKRAKHRERMANDPEYAERKRATGRKSDAKRSSYRVRNRGNRRKSKAQPDLFEP